MSRVAIASSPATADAQLLVFADRLAKTSRALVPVETRQCLVESGCGVLLGSRADALLDAQPAMSLACTLRLAAARSASAAWVIANLAEGAALAARLGGARARGTMTDARVRFVGIAHEPGGLRLEPRGELVELNGCSEPIPALAPEDAVLLPVEGPAGRACVLAPLNQARLEMLEAPGTLAQAGFARATFDRVSLPRDAVVPVAELAQSVLPSRLVSQGSAPHELELPQGLLWLVAIVLGCAEAAYSDYVSTTRRRVAAVDGAAVAEMRHVQARVGESGAELDAAVLLFDSMVSRLAPWHAPGPPVLVAELARFGRDAAFIARRCLEVVTRLTRQMGALGLVETNPVQHRFRDVRCLASDRRLAFERLTAQFGRVELGVPR